MKTCTSASATADILHEDVYEYCAVPTTGVHEDVVYKQQAK